MKFPIQITVSEAIKLLWSWFASNRAITIDIDYYNQHSGSRKEDTIYSIEEFKKFVSMGDMNVDDHILIMHVSCIVPHYVVGDRVLVMDYRAFHATPPKEGIIKEIGALGMTKPYTIEFNNDDCDTGKFHRHEMCKIPKDFTINL